MVRIITKERFEFVSLLSLLKERNFVLVSPDNVEKATSIIKQWIAITLAEKYDKDAKKMIEEKKYSFQFRGNYLLNDNEIILITND